MGDRKQCLKNGKKNSKFDRSNEPTGPRSSTIPKHKKHEENRKACYHRHAETGLNRQFLNRNENPDDRVLLRKQGTETKGSIFHKS